MTRPPKYSDEERHSSSTAFLLWAACLLGACGIHRFYLGKPVTGLIYLLRWFWWRINAWSEISAMMISFVLALYFNFADLPGWSDWQRLLAGVLFTTIGWLAVTLLAPKTDERTMREFVKLVQPAGRGWKKVERAALADGEDLRDGKAPDNLPGALLNVLLASIGVYAALFAIGFGLYGQQALGLGLGVLAAACGLLVARRWTS